MISIEHCEELRGIDWPLPMGRIFHSDEIDTQVRQGHTPMLGTIVTDGEGFDVQILEATGPSILFSWQVFRIWCAHSRAEKLWAGGVTFRTKGEFIEAMENWVPTPRYRDIGHGFFGIWVISKINEDQTTEGDWLVDDDPASDHERIEFKTLSQAIERTKELVPYVNEIHMSIAKIGTDGEPLFI